jgi:uroporphyrinogen-III synthase
MPTLNGARVALLESRRAKELSELVRRLGGVPHAVPALREAPRLEAVPAFIDRLSAARFSTVIFLTGAGVTALLREAQRLSRLDETLAALRAIRIVCRGPKPEAVLDRYHIRPQIKAAAPFTTNELLDATLELPLVDDHIAVVHYGEVNQPLTAALKERAAAVDDFVLYEWMMPDDPGPLAALVGDVIGRRVDAIAFTSQIQCRYLFATAEAGERLSDLQAALQTDIVVAAMGPVCAAALRVHDVIPDVLPAQPRMGALITALADFIELSSDSGGC